jgi:hypothetical protein
MGILCRPSNQLTSRHNYCLHSAIREVTGRRIGATGRKSGTTMLPEHRWVIPENRITREHGRTEILDRGELFLSFSITRKGFRFILLHLNENTKTH